MTKPLFPLALALALVAAPAFAQHGHHGGHGSSMAMPAGAAVEPTEGVVQKIDRDAGKITLKHGEIPNLGMPPMTMVFGAADAKLLANVKAGDKVRFKAEQPGGAYVVTAIDIVK